MPQGHKCTYNIPNTVLLLFSLKFFIGSSTRDPYLRDLENQIAKKEERKRREQSDHMPEWWEKNPQPQVQIPSRPHPSQVISKIPIL